MVERLFSDVPAWASLPTLCHGCGFRWGSFNVATTRKCPRCAVYGTAYRPGERPEERGAA